MGGGLRFLKVKLVVMEVKNLAGLTLESEKRIDKLRNQITG